MSKHSLMLSAATVALLTGGAMADTDITKATTTSLTTGTLPSGAPGTGDAGNVTIESGGAITVTNSTSGSGAIVINSNNFVSNLGVITNKDASTATGILVDMTKNPNPLNPANTANTSAFGINLGASSSLLMSGSGTNKRGIWLYNSDAASGTLYTFNGPITFENSSTMSLNGDNSIGIQIDQNSVLQGDMTLGGAISLAQTTPTSTAGSGLYGLLMSGKVQGNISLPSGGTLSAVGSGATGMSIQGQGVTGSISIGGTLTTVGVNLSALTITTKLTNTNNPEAGTALAVGANVGSGIEILGPTATSSSTGAGSVSVQGLGPAVLISPYVNQIYAGAAPPSPLQIGVYADAADPGFSFYNRGSMSVQPSNVNEAGVVGMRIIGYSEALPTILTGGMYNSGALTASITTSGTTASANSSIALYIDNFAILSAGSGKNDATASDPGDKAALVNSSLAGGGTITASVSGTRGGTATAIYINQSASVPSIINSGTITASATTTDATITNVLKAGAIIDASGTLTSITNSGTISAVAGVSAGTSTPSALNNNSQIARAIDLSSGTPSSPSGTGVTITSVSGANSSATIVGDVLFGTGNNQVLILQGNGPLHPSTVTGNVSYGLLASGNTSGDQLTIGNYASLSGIVTAPDGVAVDIANHGTLALLNAKTSLSATTFHVANGGAVSLSVSESLTATGVVSAQSATFDSGSNLGVAYTSFVPQGNRDFVLLTANKGQLSIDPLAVSTYNTSLGKDIGSGGAKPFLFQSASLAVDTTSSASVDELVLAVVPKTDAQLGLTGYAQQVFPYANTALGIDDSLGAAMINGVHNAAQAQEAYDAYAPNVSGGSRAIAISITDQATGPVGARQRALRMYAKTDGEMTLWAEEFAQMIKDPGQGATQANGFKLKPGFKDHGFGFALGLDGGAPRYGWFGGAFTFYAGDVNELYDPSTYSGRDSHSNQQWYILSLYSVWRGTGLFFDSKIDAGYGHVDGKRFINLPIPIGVDSTGTTIYSTYVREADNKHSGALLSGGFSTGAMLSYGAATFTPMLAVDGLLMREDGYTETNPGTATIGDGFNLKVQPYYAKSLRAFIGASARYDLDLWGFYLQPEARLGYRYDLFNDPVKLKAAFAHADTTGGIATSGTPFTVTGPDPSQGNFVLGGTISATTDTWTLGFNYDMVRGTNGALEQVGTIHLLGRI